MESESGRLPGRPLTWAPLLAGAVPCRRCGGLPVVRTDRNDLLIAEHDPENSATRGNPTCELRDVQLWTDENTVEALVPYWNEVMDPDALPDDYFTAQEGESGFDRGTVAMRTALDAGRDDGTAFRLALIEAGFLENVPAPPEPA